MHPLLLLWLSGIGLRLTIMAVPPVLALIRHDLGLSATEVGLLSGIPPGFFAVAALAGSLLVARLGVKSALVGGLVIVAAGSALRGMTAGFPSLLAATALMSAGVAIMQPVMPTAVKGWVPRRIALGTAVYINGLLVGEIIPVVLTLPLVLPWMGGSWRASFVAWAVPIVVIALLVAIGAPRGVTLQSNQPGPPRQWLPDWRSGQLWRLGALFCCINAIYFSANAFIPIYLTSQGRPELISGALSALNFGQLPASFLLLAVAKRIERRAWPYIASGVISLISIVGLVAFVGRLTWIWAGLLGFSDAAALIVALTLPPLLCKPEDVARTSAGVFTLSYGGAVLIALICGAAWDLSGQPFTSFVPLAICSIALGTLAVRMRATDELV
jgi:CP family cyanate transporter-like MFS transporter